MRPKPTNMLNLIILTVEVQVLACRTLSNFSLSHFWVDPVKAMVLIGNMDKGLKKRLV